MCQPFSTCSIHLGSSGTENEGTNDVNRGRQKQPMNRGIAQLRLVHRVLCFVGSGIFQDTNRPTKRKQHKVTLLQRSILECSEKYTTTQADHQSKIIKENTWKNTSRWGKNTWTIHVSRTSLIILLNERGFVPCIRAFLQFLHVITANFWLMSTLDEKREGTIEIHLSIRWNDYWRSSP